MKKIAVSLLLSIMITSLTYASGDKLELECDILRTKVSKSEPFSIKYHTSNKLYSDSLSLEESGAIIVLGKDKAQSYDDNNINELMNRNDLKGKTVLFLVRDRNIDDRLTNDLKLYSGKILSSNFETYEKSVAMRSYNMFEDAKIEHSNFDEKFYITCNQY